MDLLLIRCISTLLIGGHVVSGGKLNLIKASTLTDKVWDRTDLSARISVRLVKKSWKPEGITYDQNIDEFPGEFEEAYRILTTTKLYDYIERPLARSGELFTVKGDRDEPEFDHNLDSILIISPVPNDKSSEGHFSSTLVTALGIRNLQRYKNIFLVHMPELKTFMMNTILREITGFKTHYEDMAEALCSFILEGIRKQHWEPKKINFLSYSYSGNLAGYMARIVETATNTKINSIMGLDPYSPPNNKHLTQLSKNDADVVHILHSSNLGTRKRIGTANFVFNSGLIQPECSGLMNFMRKMTRSPSSAWPCFCSHLHITTRFWYIIIFPSKFQARQCNSWHLFQSCACEEENRKTVMITYPIVNRDVHGTFHLRTTGTKPYGLGDEGGHCSLEATKKLEKLKEGKKSNLEPSN